MRHPQQSRQRNESVDNTSKNFLFIEEMLILLLSSEINGVQAKLDSRHVRSVESGLRAAADEARRDARYDCSTCTYVYA